MMRMFEGKEIIIISQKFYLGDEQAPADTDASSH